MYNELKYFKTASWNKCKTECVWNTHPGAILILNRMNIYPVTTHIDLTKCLKSAFSWRLVLLAGSTPRIVTFCKGRVPLSLSRRYEPKKDIRRDRNCPGFIFTLSCRIVLLFFRCSTQCGSLEFSRVYSGFLSISHGSKLIT